jgi:hypothetical protein
MVGRLWRLRREGLEGRWSQSWENSGEEGVRRMSSRTDEMYAVARNGCPCLLEDVSFNHGKIREGGLAVLASSETAKTWSKWERHDSRSQCPQGGGESPDIRAVCQSTAN